MYFLLNLKKKKKKKKKNDQMMVGGLRQKYSRRSDSSEKYFTSGKGWGTRILQTDNADRFFL